MKKIELDFKKNYKLQTIEFRYNNEIYLNLLKFYNKRLLFS
jgi:hypothetical protein